MVGKRWRMDEREERRGEERRGEERRGEIKSVLKLPERDLSCLRTCSGMAKSDCPDSRNCNYRHNNSP